MARGSHDEKGNWALFVTKVKIKKILINLIESFKDKKVKVDI